MDTFLPFAEAQFSRPKLEVPLTFGVKFAGSKLRMLPHLVSKFGLGRKQTALDAFAGTTRVSQALLTLGYEVTANDISPFSSVFATCFLKASKARSEYLELIQHLNTLPGQEGWFTNNYGGGAGSCEALGEDGCRKPWQIHNAMKLDAIRTEIDNLALSLVDRSVALAALILSLDAVDNTLGHFASYLKNWSPRSYKSMYLKVPDYVEGDKLNHKVCQADVFEAVSGKSFDLAYLDPPYGSNNDKMPPSRVRYAAYYHIWNTIALNDKPELFGRSRRREDSRDSFASPFEDFRRNKEGRFVAVEAIRRLVEQIDAYRIVISYSSGGRATLEELIDLVDDFGSDVTVEAFDYKKNVMASMTSTKEWSRELSAPHQEYLISFVKSS